MYLTQRLMCHRPLKCTFIVFFFLREEGRKKKKEKSQEEGRMDERKGERKIQVKLAG